MIVLAALVAGASAFIPQKAAFARSVAVYQEKPRSGEQAAELGYSMGGEAHTRDPTPQVNDDPRKTIPEGESFEEYMKSRAAGG